MANPPYRAELRSAKGDANEVWARLGVLEAIGENAERESLRAGDGLITGLPVRENAGKVGYLGDPPAVLFALRLNSKMHQCDVARMLPRRERSERDSPPVSR